MNKFDLSEYSSVLESHRGWLAQFGSEHLKKWELILDSDPEAACAEACFAAFANARAQTVEPADKTGVGGMDFRISTPEFEYLAEVTCMRDTAISNKTGIPTNDQLARAIERAISEKSHSLGASSFRLPRELLASKANEKLRQCLTADIPTLLVAVTFSWSVRGFEIKEMCEEALRGREGMSFPFDRHTGTVSREMERTTDLEGAVFLVLDEHDRQIVPARTAISGLLLMSIAPQKDAPPRIHACGAINPAPDHVFPAPPLSGVEFVELAEGWRAGSFSLREMRRPNTESSATSREAN